MEIIKAFCIAFSIYSKIPMPQFKWEEKDMRYHFIFFPFVGVVIGGLLYLWNYICLYFGIGTLTYTCIGTAIPVIVTGGFHIDGFMDTMDAFKSYKSKEEKLKIMQDAHIGAFSVIMLAAWGLCFMGAFSFFGDNDFFMDEIFGVFAGIFVLSRILSAFLALSLKGAKDDGMLHTFSDSTVSKKGFVKTILLIELIICFGYMFWCNSILSILVAVAAMVYIIYYWWKTKKELGGITGDTAGYFVVCLEVILTIAVAVYGFWLSNLSVGIG